MAIRTEKQNRRWLYSKLKNFLCKIITANAYGVLRGQSTIAKDLKKIIKEFEDNI